MIFPVLGKTRLPTFARHTTTVHDHSLHISRRRERQTIFSLVWLAGICVLSLLTHLQFAVPLVGLFCVLRGIETRSGIFFIPGGLLSGVGLGMLLTAGPLSLFRGDVASGIFLLFWALGMFSITLLSRSFTHTPQWWPLILGTMLLLTSVTLFA